MTQKKSNAPPPRNTSRKKRKSVSWVIPFGLAAGILFAICFYVGLHPTRQGGAAPPSSESSRAESLGVKNTADESGPARVQVRELPEETASLSEEGTPRRESRRHRKRAEKRAVGAAVVAPVAPTPAASPAEGDKTDAPKDEFQALGNGSKDAVPKKEASPAKPEPPPVPSNFRVQAGAYQTEENARKMADRLAASGYQPAVSTAKSAEGTTTYRVQVGPFPAKKAAESAVRDLGSQGVPARVVDEDHDEGTGDR